MALPLLLLSAFFSPISHSKLAEKPLKVAVPPATIAFAYDTATGVLRDYAHRSSVDGLGKDSENSQNAGDMKIAREFSRGAAKLEAGYDYGGTLTQGMKITSSNDLKRKAINTGTSVIGKI